MRRLLLILAISLPGFAQSITVTTPTPNQVLSGFAGFKFTVSLASAPSVSRVCYTIDAYPLPGTAPDCITAAPWSANWDTFWVWNGPHQVVATAYDARGATVATSPAVAFTVTNTWPCSWAPKISISTGTLVTSNWSGQVSVGGTLSGSFAGSDSFQWDWYIDGVQQQQSSNSNATNSELVDTTQFADGPHVVALVTTDTGSSCSSYGDGYAGNATEWSATINFSNGATPSELRETAHEVFLSPGATYTLSPVLVSANGSPVSNPTFDFYSTNTALCTVGTATGSNSIVTAVARGACQVRTMAEVSSGTDLSVVGGTSGSFVTSSSYTFKNSDSGRFIHITSSTGGWVPGFYEIGGFQTGFGVGLSPYPNFCPSTTCTGGHFAVGPSRTTWVMVNSTNILPHFGTDGSILTSYNPAKSFFMHDMFSSNIGFSGQPYNTINTNAAQSFLGFGDDINSSGLNTVELGITPNQPAGTDTQTSWQNTQTAALATQQAITAPWPKIRYFGTGDNVTGGMYYATRGPCSTWTPPCMQYLFQAMKNTGSFIGVSWQDEIQGPWSCCPLQGPIQFVSSPTKQSGLTSIVSNGSTCTVNWTGWAFSGYGSFVIHGATTAGFNSSAGTSFAPSSVNSNQFTFPCSVTSGTYNASTDPGLTIEPQFYGWAGSDYIHYDDWAQLMTQVNNVTGRTPVTGSNQSGTNLQSVANWSGNGVQSVGGISQVADFADMYWSHSTQENYLAGRINSNMLISDDPNATAGVEEGYHVRYYYGQGFDPGKPLTIETQGTTSLYGLQGYTVPISTISNGVVTFASPHNLSIATPAVTRLSISGSSNSAYNTNFNVIGVLNPTQLSVALAVTDFNPGCTGSGGTITFQNGDTKGVSSICASGSLQANGGDSLTYSGSADGNMPRHRGQTFTLSGITGTGSATWNSRTFVYTPENFSQATDGNGSAASYFTYREIPTGSSTGGSATIIADDLFVKGRNADWGATTHPGFGFVSAMEAAILRGAGQRLYQVSSAAQERFDHAVTLSNGVLIKAGWLGFYSSGFAVTYGDNQREIQLQAHPHWENGFSVPIFHANSTAALLINANTKYILQPALNSPDYGRLLDCAARAGSYGDIIMCVNGSEGSQTRTFNLSPYLQTGQSIVRYIAGPRDIIMSVLGPGTPSDTVTLNADEAVFYVFPANFASELVQPTVSVNLGDISGATQFAVRYSYDVYTLDQPINTVQTCASSPCVLSVNRNIGPIYYRVMYLNSANVVLATGDIQIM